MGQISDDFAQLKTSPGPSAHLAGVSSPFLKETQIVNAAQRTSANFSFVMKDAKSLRILVVDDHEGFREQVCALLKSQPGFEVICQAANGLEGVSRAEELQPDVVVLDISMPSLGGIEAAGRIHRVASKSQIVFLSQHNSETIAQTALATGALAYVTKSSASNDLIRAVKAVSEGKKFVSKLTRWGSKRDVE